MDNKKSECSGRCLCGGVEYHLSTQPRDIFNCHCALCRKQHGAFGAYASARKKDLTIVNGESLAWYQSSDHARRGFCNNCGAGLFWEDLEAKHIAILAGSLDDSTALTTAGHIFTAEKGAFYEIADDLVQYAHSFDEPSVEH